MVYNRIEPQTKINSVASSAALKVAIGCFAS